MSQALQIDPVSFSYAAATASTAPRADVADQNQSSFAAAFQDADSSPADSSSAAQTQTSSAASAKTDSDAAPSSAGVQDKNDGAATSGTAISYPVDGQGSDATGSTALQQQRIDAGQDAAGPIAAAAPGTQSSQAKPVLDSFAGSDSGLGEACKAKGSTANSSSGLGKKHLSAAAATAGTSTESLANVAANLSITAPPASSQPTARTGPAATGAAIQGAPAKSGRQSPAALPVNSRAVKLPTVSQTGAAVPDGKAPQSIGPAAASAGTPQATPPAQAPAVAAQIAVDSFQKVSAQNVAANPTQSSGIDSAVVASQSPARASIPPSNRADPDSKSDPSAAAASSGLSTALIAAGAPALASTHTASGVSFEASLVPAHNSAMAPATFTPAQSGNHGAQNAPSTNQSLSADATAPRSTDRRAGLEVGFHDTTLGWLSVRASVDPAGDIHAFLGGRGQTANNAVTTMLPALGRFLQEQNVPVQSVSGGGAAAAGLGVAANTASSSSAFAGGAGTGSPGQGNTEGGRGNSARNPSGDSAWSGGNGPASGIAAVSSSPGLIEQPAIFGGGGGRASYVNVRI